MTKAQIAYCKGKCKTIAINNSYILAPWADVLYACDKRWWLDNPEALEFKGLKVTLTDPISDKVHRLNYSPGQEGTKGLSLDPTKLRTGRNGGYQSINLAVLFGAKRIILLGIDMRCQKGKPGEMRTHWHAGHKRVLNPSTLESMIPHFDTLKQPLKELGVEVINCSPGSAVRAFPLRKLEDVL